MIFKHEAEFARNHAVLPAKIFMSVGGLEDSETMSKPIQKFATILAGRQYRGLDLNTVVIADETHFSVNPAAVVKGMKTVLSTQSNGEPKS